MTPEPDTRLDGPYDAVPDGPAADPSDVELQLRVEEIERSEERDRARWLALLVGVLGGLAVARWSLTVTGVMFVLVALVATGLGVFQVRRGQRKRVLEQELDERRAKELAAADSPAHRLAALHDELDRLDDVPTGFREVVLLAAAACLFVALGLSEGITWVSSAGVFAGLAALLRGRGVMADRRRKSALRDEIEQIEEDAHDDGRLSAEAPDGSVITAEEPGFGGTGRHPPV